MDCLARLGFGPKCLPVEKQIKFSNRNHPKNLLGVLGCIQPLEKLVRFSLADPERRSGLYSSLKNRANSVKKEWNK